jgi:hypothetical protein
MAGDEGDRLRRPDDYDVQTAQLNKQVRDRLPRVESPFRGFKELCDFYLEVLPSP